ncbi:helix-turn-helix transcriptional regulator [Halomonas lysinitropha]|uniref:MarR family protein n=1 Tax=Halomonas lysinitropha TaxID=2607506 RepID=A0A5K1IBX7_9GAMM|nr:MarR family transcriptional regulator [Halomonas lysinitropha]VVZ96379.1 MarR family protein [Halomonas lysinitropha]
MTRWSFLTTHARVLLIIAGEPDIRLRDIATALGITERRAHAVVADLVDNDYVNRQRVGRRNRYEIQSQRQINDDVIALNIGDLLDLLVRTSAKSGNIDGD